MLFRKHYHLLPAINEIVRSILESGIIRKFVSNNEISKVKLAMELAKTNDDDGRTKTAGSGGGHESSYVMLRIDHVQGAFYVGLVGALFAMIAFVGEILVFCVKGK